MRRLATLQRTVTRLITGGLRTTAQDVLDYHAFLPPLPLRATQMLRKHAVRLCTLPAQHPLHAITQRCKRVPRYHRSPIHYLIAAFPDLQCRMEAVTPTPVPTPALRAMQFTVPGSRKEAKAEAERIMASGECCIFSDGSGFEGGVGAAAVASDPGGKWQEVRRLHLGQLSAHTVFEAEITGAILALDVIQSRPRLTKAHLFIDCQPAIQAIASPSAQPAQYLLRIFHQLLARLCSARRSLTVHVHWVPGHEDIHHSDWADNEAKRAAKRSSLPLPPHMQRLLLDLPRSSAATLAEGKRHTSREWAKAWQRSPRARKLKAIGHRPPSKQARKLYADRSRAECAILTQLRTAHIPLNAYLHRIQRAPSPLCAYCQSPETVEHFLLSCRRYSMHRMELKRAHRTSAISVCALLAPGRKTGALLKYLRATQRFPDLLKTP